MTALPLILPQSLRKLIFYKFCLSSHRNIPKPQNLLYIFRELFYINDDLYILCDVDSCDKIHAFVTH